MIVLAHRMAKIYLADMTLRGSLPPGLKLDPAAISGTPAKARHLRLHDHRDE
jgi:hypothetical protein